MYLDSTESIKTIWEYHDEMSINQGRDLFVIDPRGAGLSKPLLVCDTFVENETQRLMDNLSFTEQWKEAAEDYLDCVERFKTRGVNLATYNSLSIAKDIEMMRYAAKIDQWVLIGVSYAAIYAQIITTQYSHSVESMILDSATFPNLKPHENYTQKAMESYRALYNHCDSNPDCDIPLNNTEERIWNLHNKLNADPIKLEIDHPYQNTKIEVLLNGERFIASLLNGTYNKKIFVDLPQIIVELEARRVKAISPYLESFTAYLLDTAYGDVSANSHYCYEDKPYTDFNLIRKQAGKLPVGYIRNTALLSLDFPDYCHEMQVGAGDSVVSMATKTDTPSLFLHGELDTITPLRDVIEQRKLFTHSRLMTYKVSHDVLSADECAEIVAAKFIGNTDIDPADLDCS